MNQRMVQWLYQELPGLVSKGVLSAEAADNLRGHYGDIKSAGRQWYVVVICSVMGAVLIGLGIILLFAHNWEEFSRPVRAVLSLLPLMAAQALAVWVALKKPGSAALKEGAAAFLSLMAGSSLALIGQTYNIPNDIPAFILTWMLLILPLVYLMEASVPAAMFVFGIAAWTGQTWQEPLKSFLFWPLLGLVVPHLIYALRREEYAVRSGILAFVMAFGIIFGAGMTLGRLWPGGWTVIYSSLASGFYLLGAWEFRGITKNWQRPIARLGAVGVFVLMFLFTYRFPWTGMEHHGWARNLTGWSALPGYVLTFILVCGSLLLAYQFVRRQDWMRALFGGLPLLALFGNAVSGSSPELAMALLNLYLLGVSVYRLTAGIRSNDLGVVNTGLFMLSALILARFFDSDLDFILKGLVFIVVGAGFLAVNMMVLRRKEPAPEGKGAL